MKDFSVEQIMLYDVERILFCIRHRAWSSIPAYSRHLAVLGMIQSMKEEREMYPQIVVEYPDE